MRCGRCGNDNADANRFCGMCGAPLAARPQPAGQSSKSAIGGHSAPTRQPSVPLPLVSKPAPQSSPVALASVNATPAERPSALHSSSQEESRTGPVITGPSFLGLNEPSAAGGGLHRDRHDSSTGRDPLPPSSGSLDYLLDDEGEHRGGGGKLIFIVVALALAAGLGYLHWKSGGFDWLNGGAKKAAVAKPTPDSTQTTSDSLGAPTGSDPNSSSATSTAKPTVTPTPTDGAPVNPADSTSTQAPSSQAAPSQATPAQASPSQATPGTSPTDSSVASDSASHSAPPDSEQQSDAEEPAAAAKPVARKPAVARPYAAKPSAGTRPYDSVTEAERYIYGRGVSQDCDHGLRLLKPSAEQSNPKAMISLGALYSTGTCTPRDLPTAYRWFAMALHKQPDNQALQDNLQKLWSQMTPPERQLAIKLSQ